MWCYNERITSYVLLILHFITEEFVQVVSIVAVGQNDVGTKMMIVLGYPWLIYRFLEVSAMKMQHEGNTC